MTAKVKLVPSGKIVEMTFPKTKARRQAVQHYVLACVSALGLPDRRYADEYNKPPTSTMVVADDGLTAIIDGNQYTIPSFGTAKNKNDSIKDYANSMADSIRVSTYDYTSVPGQNIHTPGEPVMVDDVEWFAYDKGTEKLECQSNVVKNQALKIPYIFLVRDSNGRLVVDRNNPSKL